MTLPQSYAQIARTEKTSATHFFAEVEVLLQKNWQSAYGRIHLCKEKNAR